MSADALTDTGRVAAAAAPWRIPVQGIAVASGLGCFAALVLSHASGGAPDARFAPWALVLGQALWNATQVGLLAILLVLWLTHRRWWVAALGITCLACLPIAIYAVSPGAWALAALLLATCAVAWLRKTPDVDFTVADATRDTPLLARFEFLACVCTLLSATYNYGANILFWVLEKFIRFPLSPAQAARGLYGLGLPGVSLPAYIKIGPQFMNLGGVLFALVWTVLPFLYVLYFAALAQQAKGMRGERLQRGLCLFGIFHFLFLTDFVAYAFGRGLANVADDWCHALEVIAWRIAILLPLYQKVVTGDWRRGYGVGGLLLHYGIAAWGVFFFFYEVLLFNSRDIYIAFTGIPVPQITGLAHNWLGYFPMLVPLTLLYAFAVVALRNKQLVIGQTE